MKKVPSALRPRVFPTCRRADAAFGRIEAGRRFAGRVGEQDGVHERRNDAALAVPLGDRGRVRDRLEHDRELVEPGTVIGRTGDVVATIGQQIERAAVAIGRSPPARHIGCQAGAGSECLAELVAMIRRNATNADEALVDQGQAADGDRVGGKRRGSRQQEGENERRNATESRRVHVKDVFMETPREKKCGDSRLASMTVT